MIEEPRFRVGAILVAVRRENFPDDVVATTFLVVKVEKENSSSVIGQQFIYHLLEDDKVELWSDTMVNKCFKELEENTNDHE